MNINGGFFSDTEDDALRQMQRIVGCEVKRCVYPTANNLTYYLSERGDLFSIQNIKGKLLTRGPKQPSSKHIHGKRKDGGTTLRLSNGRHGPGGESFIKAELLVYCTYILGRWEPDLQIDFKNGQASDIRPDNLEEHREAIPQEWSERLTTYSDIYRANFDRVAESVKWWAHISKEDAKDIAQTTFIWLCTSGYKDSVSVALWFYWSRLRAQDFWKHHARHYNTADYDTILELRGQRDTPVEVDLFHLQKGTKRVRYLELWAQGHTPTEIARECGCSLATVSSSITRSIQFLQRYFKKEQGL